MRSRTAGLAIAAIMAAATAGCVGASAIDGTTPAEPDQEHLPRVADDSELGENPSANSASTQAPDRATTVVPTPSRPGRGNAAEDPYLPPRAVIPAPTGTPDAPPPPSSPTTPPPESSTTPSEPPAESTTPAFPTLPTPERPKPLLPPNGDSGGSLWPFDEPEKPENAENPEKPAKPAKPEKPNKGTDTTQNGTNGESGENDAPTSPGTTAADDADEGTNDTGATTNGSDRED